MKLTAKHIESQKLKATEMVGKLIEIQLGRKAISIDKENHRVVFVMSTETVDRHGDIIDQESWILEYFETNPAFFFNHESYRFPLGKWVRVWKEIDPENEGKMRLVGEAEFRVQFEDAARAFEHVVAGDMNMVSVGFIPHRVDYNEHTDAFVLYDCELLECSLVGIGSNRFALAKGDEEGTRPAKEILIEGVKALDEEIDREENERSISRLKAREDLHKAIRHLDGLRK